MKNKPSFKSATTLVLLLCLVLFQSVHAQTVQTKPDLNTFASTQIVNTNALPPALSTDCIRYKKMKLAGIGLSIGGGALIIIGAAVRASAAKQAENNAQSNPLGVDPSTNSGGISAGSALVGVGCVALCAGVPLVVIGCIRYNKSCKSTTFELRGASSGTGLALAF